MIGTILALLFAAISFCIGAAGAILIGLGVKVEHPRATLIQCVALILCAATIAASALGIRL